MSALVLPRETYELQRELVAAKREHAAAKAARDAVSARLAGHSAFMMMNFHEEMREVMRLHGELVGGVENEPPAKATPLQQRWDEQERERKTLLRRIQQRCHPDKTDDPELHEVLELAAEAYERGHTDELRGLLRSIGSSRHYGRSTARAERIRAQLTLLRQQTDEMRQYVTILKNSPPYKEAENLEEITKRLGAERAKTFVRQELQKIIQNLKMRVERQRGIKYVYYTTSSPTTITTR